MAESTSLARPYARAAFESARDSNQLDAWSESLNLLSVVTEDADMAAALKHPGLSAQQKIDLITEVCGGKLPEAVQNFVRIMAENRRLALLPAIVDLFAGYRHEHERVVDVTVTTAYELTDDEKDKLSQALTRKLERKVLLDVQSDRSIIGGVVIKAGDTVIDASLRGRLGKLATAIGA